MDLTDLLFFAGIFQILLSVVSLSIPVLLNWKKELSVVSPLIRQMFWTYAGYILGINLCFGLLSVLSPVALLDHSFLATAVTLFIALYWLVRIAIQFLYFDRKSAPKGLLFTAGEAGLVTLFVFLTIVYGWSFFINMKWV